MPSDDWPDEDVSSVRRGVVRLARRLRAERPDDALSPTKIAVLGHLHRRGPSPAGEIAETEHHRPQTLTRVFAELERDGLISRTSDETDRRRSLLAITPEGFRALAEDTAVRDAWLAEAMAAFTPTERQVLKLAAALMERMAD